MTEVTDDVTRRAMIELARAYLRRFLAIQPITKDSAITVSREEAVRASLPHDEDSTDFPEAERIAEAARELRTQLAATPEPRLARLARVCSLDWMDIRIVAVLLAP